MKKDTKLQKIVISEGKEINCGDLILEAGDTIYIKEDNYGWEIKRGKEWDALEELTELMGAQAVLDALAQAMGTNELSENLAYIYRMNDINDSPYIK